MSAKNGQTAVRQMRTDDAQAVARIYNHYIAESVATFEEAAVSETEVARRLAHIEASGLKWLVAEADGAILGYAYAAPFHPRSAYRFTAETSVYIAPQMVGQGLATVLYRALLEELKRTEVKQLIALIALPHRQSVALHQKLGFSQAGTLKRVGYKFARWIDVGYFQLELAPMGDAPGGEPEASVAANGDS